MHCPVLSCMYTQASMHKAAEKALYEQPEFHARTTKAHEYRVMVTQQKLDHRRREEFVAESKAVQRRHKDKQVSKAVTRHYRKREQERRQKYEDEGKLNIYEQADPEFVSEQRARERAEEVSYCSAWLGWVGTTKKTAKLEVQYTCIDQTTLCRHIPRIQRTAWVSSTRRIDTKTVRAWGFWFYPANIGWFGKTKKKAKLEM